MGKELLPLKLQVWDDRIRQGNFALVRDEVLHLSRAQIPRALIAPMASIAYRSGLSYWALKLLSPVINPEKPVVPAASPQEKIAYAAALFRIGVTQEAFDLLKKINWEDHPIVLLHQAYGNFRLWEYQASVPLLKKFLKRTSPEEYQYLVGQVNLIASLIFVEDYASAETLVQEVLETTAAKGFHLLHGNALELISQIRIFQGNYESAETYLNLSEKKLSTSTGSYSFFVRKWKTLSLWFQEGRNEKTQRALDLLRVEAKGLRHWETLRDCDYYQALKTKDPSLITHLSFGTPFPGYRRRLKNKIGLPPKMTASYSWNPVAENLEPAASVVLDPHSSLLVTGLAQSKQPAGLRKTLITLCRDFYRPLPQGELFTGMFPEEYFNPFSSPSRIDLVIRRLRNWFDVNGIPLQIEVMHKEYRLVATGTCTIKVFRRQKTKSKFDLLLLALQSEFGHKSFKQAEVSAALGVSKTTVKRLLKAGVEVGKVFKSDSGSACRYRFKK